MIFVDTSAWYASEVEDDISHTMARRFLKNDLATGKYGMLVTSDYVLDETLTLLRMRKSSKDALSFINKVRSSESIRVVWAGTDIFESAIELLSKHDDAREKFSFTDCTSFSIMKNLSIDLAFAFDKHYEKAHFKMLPKRSKNP